MKSLKSLASAALLIAVSMGFTSCSDDDEAFVVAFDNASILMDSNTSAWGEVYDVNFTGKLQYSGFSFSHTASASEWGGVTYYSWGGFCPTLSSDVEDRTEAGDWVNHQWGAITGKGVKAGRPYMIAYWDEYTESMMNGDKILKISYTLGDKVFKPQSVAVTNSTWAYYAMKNGSAPAKPFGDNDYLYVYANGVKGGTVTGTVKIELAKGKNILNSWKSVDLTSLGEVNYIYFTMESSDASDYGMNTPAYFCLDDFKVIVE